MKRTPLRRKSLKKRNVDKTRTEKVKLPSIKTIRNKCDALLTPIIKKIYPFSILGGGRTEVAHHHVHKSKSTALRYVLDNLIPLTHKEHQALHHNESFWASKIVQIKGVEWFNELEKKKNEIVKADIHWYLENYKRLKEIYEQNNK